MSITEMRCKHRLRYMRPERQRTGEAITYNQ